MNKNSTNDPRIGFKPFFNLLDLIEANAELKKELEIFLKIFERDFENIIYYKKKLCNILIIL